jgi:hypothetical protein
MSWTVLAAASVALVALGWTSADANEQCRLDKPTVTRSPAQLKVSVVCQPAQSPATVRYPSGPLYIGVTLYKVDTPGLHDRVVPIVEDRVEHTYVKPAGFSRPSASQEITVPLGNLGANTHILVAIWDKKTDCPADSQSEGCKVAGATFGDLDSFELPIPVDAWPRPVCNVQQLTRSGFFQWVATDGDFGGPQVPDKYSSMLQANDCFMRFENRAGLGFSVRQWRAQPLPKS